MHLLCDRSRRTSASAWSRALDWCARRSLPLAIAASLSLASAACGSSQATPQLATGERMVTGDARYDRFFGEVNEMVISVREAKREHGDVHAALARRAGLPEDAPPDALGVRLRERTARLAAEGLTLELEFTGIDGDDADEEPAPSGNPELPPESPEPAGARATGAPPPVPTATLRTPGREPERRELRLLEVLARAALSAATNYASMGRIQQRVDQLLTQIPELRKGTALAFGDLDQREAVESKLNEAAVFLPELGVEAQRVVGQADTLIAMLDEAANTAQLPQRRRGPREAPPTREATPREGNAERPARRPAQKNESSPATPARPDADFEP